MVGRLGCHVHDVAGQLHPVAQHGIRGQLACADRVGHDRQRLAPCRAGARQRFGGGQQVLEMIDAEHAGAAQRRLEGTIGATAGVLD